MLSRVSLFRGAGLRFFSQIKRIEKYINLKDKKTKLIRHHIQKHGGNQHYDGISSWNTNYLKKYKPKELDIQPKQHPTNLKAEDPNIVSYQPPVVNLSPFE